MYRKTLHADPAHFGLRMIAGWIDIHNKARIWNPMLGDAWCIVKVG